MSFQVSVLPSERHFQVERDESILMAGIRQSVGLPYGCKDGACGSCKCKKVSGEVQLREYQSKALSEQERADGFILTCCATPLSDVVLESRQVVREGVLPIKKLPVRVKTLQRLLGDVMLLELQLPATDPLQYHAGQYIEFILRDGSHRGYSIANAPHRTAELGPGLELHVRHMPGGKFTDHVFGAMKEKEILRVEGPMGSFYLRESNKPMIFLASGTGFAPIKALLEQMQFSQDPRPVSFYWGGRQLGDLYMNDWVLDMQKTMPQLRYVPVISDARVEDNWTGRTGFVHQAVMQDWPDLSGHQVYACGAPIVVNAARADFSTQCRLDPEAFFADSFISEKDKVGVNKA